MENKRENQKDMTISSPEHRDSFMYSMSLRSEKILSALYMVTDCMEGEDPIKQKVRTLGVNMVEKVRAITIGLPTERHLLFREVSHICTMVTGYLSVAKTIGFISEMNYSILATEIHTVNEILDKNILSAEAILVTRGKGFNLPENFFKESGPIGVLDTQGVSYKGQINYNNNVLNNVQYGVRINQKTAVNLPKQSLSDTRIPKIKIDRKKIILDTVKQKQNVMIKDVIPLFTDCSEKTIQRELSDLVSQGLLKKTGDKRWSKYSIPII